jgi:hypothetical protein
LSIQNVAKSLFVFILQSRIIYDISLAKKVTNRGAP